LTKLSDFPAAVAAPALADTLVGITAGNVDTKWPFALIAALRFSTKTASYTLVAADANTWIEMNVATANNLTIPPNSSVALPVGTVITVVQIGAGQVTLVPGSGVTILSSGSALRLNGQYSNAMLYKRATDTWVALGALV
jgi:hypothetical protein